MGIIKTAVTRMIEDAVAAAAASINGRIDVLVASTAGALSGIDTRLKALEALGPALAEQQRADLATLRAEFEELDALSASIKATPQ